MNRMGSPVSASIMTSQITFMDIQVCFPAIWPTHPSLLTAAGMRCLVMEREWNEETTGNLNERGWDEAWSFGRIEIKHRVLLHYDKSNWMTDSIPSVIHKYTLRISVAEVAH